MAKKILVIDDEPEIISLMTGWLTHEGYEVISAQDGDQGLWQIKSQKPDLIILDALIPGMTGYQLLEEVKNQSAEIREIPVILISGRASMREIETNVFAFVSKPFDPKDFLEKIRAALKLKQEKDHG